MDNNGWRERFDEKFTDNPVFWSELVSEWHQGDVDVKPFLLFIQHELHTAIEEERKRFDREKRKFQLDLERFNEELYYHGRVKCNEEQHLDERIYCKFFEVLYKKYSPSDKETEK